MKQIRITAACILVVAIVFPFNTAVAAGNGIFKGKVQSQHALTKWEKNKLEAEFKSQFNGMDSGAFQKLNNNPWEAKRAREDRGNQSGTQSNTWGNCREFAYKQRGQCYARGGDAYTCERYYDARVNHCNAIF